MDKKKKLLNDTELTAKSAESLRQHLATMVRTAMFTALITICSQITIPMPPPLVPFTLQTLAVFLAGSFLGCKRSVLCVMIYLLLGMCGLPVFSQFRGGIGVLMGPTGGYIIGFLAIAFLVGLFQDKFGNRIWSMALSMTIGLFVCYLFGTVWFLILYRQNNGADSINLWGALTLCVFPFLLVDGLKIVAAVFLSNRLHKIIK